MKCPTHGEDLVATATDFGPRYDCPVAGCTMRCWSGSTLSPADAETRAARHAAHAAFDSLWKVSGAPMSRGEAYCWLSHRLSLPQEECHIGMFAAEQCREVVAAVARRQPLPQNPHYVPPVLHWHPSRRKSK